jgi:hypothetical protein
MNVHDTLEQRWILTPLPPFFKGYVCVNSWESEFFG